MVEPFDSLFRRIKNDEPGEFTELEKKAIDILYRAFIQCKDRHCTYRRIRYNLKGYFNKIYRKEDEKPLSEITSEVREITENYDISLNALERILRSYQVGQVEGRIRGPPWLYESRPGIWRYSNEIPNKIISKKDLLGS